MRNSNDFKFDITVAFVIFAFLIVISVTYISIFFFTKISTQEFQEKVKISANNIIQIYKTKEDIIKKSTLAIANSELFSNEFKINPEIVSSIFKIFLSANRDFLKIKYVNQYGKTIVYCKKIDHEIMCGENDKNNFIFRDFKLQTSIFTKEIMTNEGLVFETISPIKGDSKKGFIILESTLKRLFNNSSNFYNLLLIDQEGRIYYSNFLKAKSIFDLFTYTLADRIKKANDMFVTNDIYVVSLNKKFKLVFIQNKKLINKTNEVSQKLAMIMILISVFLAIPLGIFFSKPLYNFYRDLDKRVKEEIAKTQEKDQLLMHQSKLAALGEMLGNIAHQWRHPLTRLSLLIQNLEMAYNKNKLDKEFLENFQKKALSQIEYMSQTIDDFTNFFKKDTKKEHFCPKEIIEQALQLMDARIKQNKLEIIFDVKNTEPIEGYKSEFSQVILNIINNAIDILKERNVQNKKIWIRIKGKTIEIEDNAGGIPEEIRDKIFEPYFTTKFQSQGTGIGLYMSRVIITQHFNGELYAYNSENGAVFVIQMDKTK
ncbi:PAS/PAC sensor signal transduction histidine kinase [Nautilia profundicola AmH]|uniref:histidine kinase n=1 Tax=Nautilia profundicola (strain ATCC BAA-1463 / DSM 18972 / AmH) TaxID=598659 RepID=B9L8L6_NAUPA|nr:HAMP domain-containing sensor histidine kinase [Nautilia profundicola]ACM93284.1 PAS/PAC sensor signal transduction histidine kinase [Nautilia profundicola AmH]